MTWHPDSIQCGTFQSNEHVHHQRDVAVLPHWAGAGRFCARWNLGIVKTQMKWYFIYATDDAVVAEKMGFRRRLNNAGPGFVMMHAHLYDFRCRECGRNQVHVHSFGPESPCYRWGTDIRRKPGRARSFAPPCAASQFVPVQSTSASGELTKITQNQLFYSMANNDMVSSMPLLPGMSVEVRLKGADQFNYKDSNDLGISERSPGCHCQERSDADLNPAHKRYRFTSFATQTAFLKIWKYPIVCLAGCVYLFKSCPALIVVTTMFVALPHIPKLLRRSES